MRALVRRFDRFLRAAYGIFEFTADGEGLLRLRVRGAPHTLFLPDGIIAKGEPVLELHLWNEHVPPLPPTGPDLAWAARVRRMLDFSFGAVARQMTWDPRLGEVRAVGGVTVLLSPGDPRGGTRLMERLGFMVLPYRNVLGRFGEFWENLYSWGLMWTFNAASLRRRSLFRLRRGEVWMSRGEFLRRYGFSA